MLCCREAVEMSSPKKTYQSPLLPQPPPSRSEENDKDNNDNHQQVVRNAAHAAGYKDQSRHVSWCSNPIIHEIWSIFIHQVGCSTPLGLRSPKQKSDNKTVDGTSPWDAAPDSSRESRQLRGTAYSTHPASPAGVHRHRSSSWWFFLPPLRQAAWAWVMQEQIGDMLCCRSMDHADNKAPGRVAKNLSYTKCAFF